MPEVRARIEWARRVGFLGAMTLSRSLKWLRGVDANTAPGRFLRLIGRILTPGRLRLWFRVENGPAIGLWVKVNPRIGRGIYEGRAETVVQDALVRNLGPGSVFYDVGANIGLFTLIGARYVGDSGRVVAFEPDHQVSKRLRDNILRNGFSNVDIVEAAVWSTSGSVDFYPTSPQVSPELGLGSIEPRLGALPAIRVPSVKLDDLVRQNRPPSIIKCDVEGAELEVLRGAQRLIRERRPILLCEVHSVSNTNQVSELLTGVGYELRWLDKNHFLAMTSGGPLLT